MADRKQQGNPDRQDRPSKDRDSQTADPNREGETGTDTDRKAQTRQERQGENVETAETDSPRTTEQGI